MLEWLKHNKLGVIFKVLVILKIIDQLQKEEDHLLLLQQILTEIKLFRLEKLRYG
jgi:hypothetical protein